MVHVGLLEDNARIARLSATMLQYTGHQVTIYEHPLECLQALLPFKIRDKDIAHTDELIVPAHLPIDLLILDLHLPDITGMEVIHYLLSHPRTRYMPLVLCTAASRQEISHAMNLVPHASFVEKPFKLETLTTAITKALNAPVK